MGGRRVGALLLALSLVVGLIVAQTGTSTAQGAGSSLAHEVTTTDPTEGGQIQLEDVSAFDPSGGEATFEPGTSSAESFTYSGVNAEHKYLVGISRQNPVAHPAGSFVQAVQAPEPTPTPSGDTPSDPQSPPPSDQPSPTYTDTPESGGDDQPVDSASADPATTEGSSAAVGPDPCTLVFGQSCLAAVDEVMCAAFSICNLTTPDVGPLIQQVVGLIETRCPDLNCPQVVLDQINETIYNTCEGSASACVKMGEEQVAAAVAIATTIVCDRTGESDLVGCVSALASQVAGTATELASDAQAIVYGLLLLTALI